MAETTTGPRGERPRGVQRVFQVVRTERIAPQLVRVHLGGPAFDDFVEAADPVKLATTDRYVKFLFPAPGFDLEPPYDLDALRGILPPAQLPVRRTYTVRSIDPADRTIAVDFVVHGDEGRAGPWAAAAVPGDRVALTGPGGQYSPATDAGLAHVLIADDAAIPAVASALEQMAPHARGVALIEVADAAHHAPLVAPDGVDIRWIHRDGAPYGHPLVDAVTALARPEGEVGVFAHGEREAMKRIGVILREQWGIDRRAMSLSAYWAHGRTEDAFQSEKREPVGQIFTD